MSLDPRLSGAPGDCSDIGIDWSCARAYEEMLSSLRAYGNGRGNGRPPHSEWERLVPSD